MNATALKMITKYLWLERIGSIKGARCDRMSEEAPFRSVKITLSEEALDRLAELRAIGSCRSDSATVEECIRTIYDIVIDVSSEMAIAREKKLVLSFAEQAELLRRVIVRIARFVRTQEISKVMSRETSAGT